MRAIRSGLPRFFVNAKKPRASFHGMVLPGTLLLIIIIFFFIFFVVFLRSQPSVLLRTIP